MLCFLDHIFSRSITRSFCIDNTDLEDGKAEKDRDRPSHFLSLPKIQNQALLSGLAYCISSCSMILVNKYILSGYGFSAGIFLMLYQVCYFFSDCLPLKQYITFISVSCFCCLLYPLIISWWSFAAEHCICDYSVHSIALWCYPNWTTNLEANQSLVACEYHICRNANYKHV